MMPTPISPRRRGFILLAVMLETRYTRDALFAFEDLAALASDDAFSMVIHEDVIFDGRAFIPAKGLSRV